MSTKFNKEQQKLMQNSGFFAVPTTVILSNLSPIEKLLLTCICSLSPDGFCWASNLHLSKLVGCNKDVVSRKIQQWVKCEWLETEMIIDAKTKQVKQRKIFMNTKIILKTLSTENLEGIDSKSIPIDSESVGGIDSKSRGIDLKSRVLDNRLDNSLLDNNINIPKNKNDDFNELQEVLINGLKNSVQISNEIESRELYGQPTQTPRLPLDSSTQANLEAVDPNKVANLLPKCSYFKISEHEKGLVRAWFKENNMTDLHIKLAIQEVDNWMAKADKKSSDGYKARSAPTHFRRLYDSWVIKNIAERFKAIASMQNVGKTQIEANSYQEYFEAFGEYPTSSKLTFDEIDRLSQHKAFQKFNNSSKELKQN